MQRELAKVFLAVGGDHRVAGIIFHKGVENGPWILALYCLFLHGSPGPVGTLKACWCHTQIFTLPVVLNIAQISNF